MSARRVLLCEYGATYRDDDGDRVAFTFDAPAEGSREDVLAACWREIARRERRADHGATLVSGPTARRDRAFWGYA